MRVALYIALLSLLLSSCSKEELAVPGAGVAVGVNGVLDKGINGGDVSGPADGSGSISDDGDDLNDGEGRKKKKKP